MPFSFQNYDVVNPDDKKDEEKVTDTLYVKFINCPSSVATVSYFSYQTMGVTNESTTPTGNWSANILTANRRVLPGGSVFFTLKIPNPHWARYHLGIIDGNGNVILFV